MDNNNINTSMYVCGPNKYTVRVVQEHWFGLFCGIVIILKNMAFKTIILLLGIALACQAFPPSGFPNSNFEPNQDKFGHNHNNIGSHGNQHNFGQGFGYPNSFGGYPGGFGLNKPSFGQNQGFGQNYGGFGQNYGAFGQNHGHFHPNKGLNENKFSQSGDSPNFLPKSRSNEEQLVEDIPLKPFDDSKSFKPVPGNFGPNPAGFGQNNGGFGPFSSGQNPGHFGQSPPAFGPNGFNNFAQNHDGLGPSNSFGQMPGFLGQHNRPIGFNNFGQSNGFSHGGHNAFQQRPRDIEGEQVEDPSIDVKSVSDESNVITQSDHHHHGHPDFSNQQAFGQDNFGQVGHGPWSGQNGFGSWNGQNGFGPWSGQNGFGPWSGQNGFGPWSGQNGFGPWNGQNGFGPWNGQNGFGPWQVQNGFNQEQGQVQNGFGQDNMQWPHWFGQGHGHHGHGHSHEHSEEVSGEAEPAVDGGLVEDDAKPEDEQQSGENDPVPYEAQGTTVEINAE